MEIINLKDNKKINKVNKQISEVEINKDKQISEMKINKNKQISEMKINNDKQISEVEINKDKQILEMKINDDKQISEVEINKDKQISEIEINNDKQILEIKINKVNKQISEVKINKDKQISEIEINNDKQILEIKINNDKQISEVKINKNNKQISEMKINKEVEINKDNKQILEMKINNDKQLSEMKINKDKQLSEILGNDDKLLFNLNALGSLQKNEKIAQFDDLLTVDDRWFFQGIRRWWSEDSKIKSSNNTLLVLSDSSDRINKLLEYDYIAQLEEEKKIKYNPNNKLGLEPPEEKQFKEKNEERRRMINKYLIAITNAKTGIENSRDTYSDKFTKNKFNLAIQKADDILNKLQKFKGNI